MANSSTPSPKGRFQHNVMRVGQLLMIESTCWNCGAQTIGSIPDGSLERWEEQHTCESYREEPKMMSKTMA